MKGRNLLYASYANAIQVGIKGAQVWDDEGEQQWCIELVVEANRCRVKGWAFLDPGFVELRFEKVASNAAPGFLSGVVPVIKPHENSLFELANCSPCQLRAIERRLHRFLEACIFSVVALREVGSGWTSKTADSYRFREKLYRLGGIFSQNLHGI